MNGFYFTFRSVTAAQRGLEQLRSAGIPCTMQRTPAVLAKNGCGYCLRVAGQWAGAAAGRLQAHGVQRCFSRVGTQYEEVDCDLL